MKPIRPRKIKENKQSGLYVLVFSIIIGLWFSLNLVRMFNNVIKIYTEELSWITLSDNQKREKIFGEKFTFWSYVKRNTDKTSSIAVYMPDPNTEPGAYYFSLYILYPRKIIFLTNVDREVLRKMDVDYLVLRDQEKLIKL